VLTPRRNATPTTATRIIIAPPAPQPPTVCV
jgi:hypothetical protein